MKQVWTLFLLLGSTAVFLMACSSDQSAEAVAPKQEQAIVVADIVNTNDLTLIGETGRPQFLNAYASW